MHKKEIIISPIICIYLDNIAMIQCTNMIWQVPNIQIHPAIVPCLKTKLFISKSNSWYRRCMQIRFKYWMLVLFTCRESTNKRINLSSKFETYNYLAKFETYNLSGKFKTYNLSPKFEAYRKWLLGTVTGSKTGREVNSVAHNLAVFASFSDLSADWVDSEPDTVWL